MSTGPTINLAKLERLQTQLASMRVAARALSAEAREIDEWLRAAGEGADGSVQHTIAARLKAGRAEVEGRMAQLGQLVAACERYAAGGAA